MLIRSFLFRTSKKKYEIWKILLVTRTMDVGVQLKPKENKYNNERV